MAIKKSELYGSLWKSCDELRGGMDASQYKDYVLVLLFVKYVSDKYAGQKDALLDVPKGGSFADMVAAKGVAALKDASAEMQSGMRQLAEASLVRLRNWDISEEQIKALAAGGEAKRTLSFRSPVGGVVLEKKAVAGMRFMPGKMLYQIADLSSVWVLADVFERDIASIQTGQQATVDIDAYPGRTFAGKVSYVYPTLNAQTRTVPVRIELPNPRGELRPAMYANIEIKIGAEGTRSGGGPAGGGGAATASDAGTAQVLAIPISAVIDNGAQQRVLVQKEEGRFEPREVKLGARGDAYVEVIEGVKDGEPVTVSAGKQGLTFNGKLAQAA